MTPAAPTSGEARARRDRGYAPVDRRLPAHRTFTTFARVPRQVLRDPALSAAAKLTIAAVCAYCPDETMHATDARNTDLGHQVGLGPRAIQLGLVEAEAAGHLFRLDRRNPLDLDTLQLVGYRDPWASPGHARPTRAIVLLWRLPHPRDLGGGVEWCAPRGAGSCAPMSPAGGG